MTLAVKEHQSPLALTGEKVTYDGGELLAKVLRAGIRLETGRTR